MGIQTDGENMKENKNQISKSTVFLLISILMIALLAIIGKVAYHSEKVAIPEAQAKMEEIPVTEIATTTNLMVMPTLTDNPTEATLNKLGFSMSNTFKFSVK